MVLITSMHTHDLYLYIYDSLNGLLQPTAKMLQNESYHLRLFLAVVMKYTYPSYSSKLQSFRMDSAWPFLLVTVEKKQLM